MENPIDADEVQKAAEEALNLEEEEEECDQRWIILLLLLLFAVAVW